MKTVISETRALLAAGLLSTAMLGGPVHAAGNDHEQSSATMHQGSPRMAFGQEMERMGSEGVGQRGGMRGGQQGMMGGEMPMGMMGGDAAMGMMGGMRRMQQALDQLDLSDEQRTELRALRHAHREAQFERMARMMNAREDLHALMSVEQPDPRRVREQHGRMAEIHGEMLAEQVRLQNAMRQLLTEQQRQALQRRLTSDQDPESPEQDDHDAHH